MHEAGSVLTGSGKPTARDERSGYFFYALYCRLVINSPLLARELGIRANNAPRYIQPLEKAEVLVEFTDRKRNRVWRAPEILQALDAFATRAGRRSIE